MSEKITITKNKNNGAIEVLVDSEYYNDNLIYRQPLKV